MLVLSISPIFFQSVFSRLIYSNMHSSQCELIETPFARRLDASLIDVLVKLRSIPGFLAQITQDLFNRQTMTVHH